MLYGSPPTILRIAVWLIESDPFNNNFYYFIYKLFKLWGSAF